MPNQKERKKNIYKKKMTKHAIGNRTTRKNYIFILGTVKMVNYVRDLSPPRRNRVCLFSVVWTFDQRTLKFEIDTRFDKSLCNSVVY